MDSVLAQEAQITAALDLAGIPGLGQAQLMGYSHREAINAVKFSRDLRSRYIFTSLCWDIGLTRVMVACEPWNDGSRKTILRNGGVYEKTVHEDGENIDLEHYWISLT